MRCSDGKFAQKTDNLEKSRSVGDRKVGIGVCVYNCYIAFSMIALLTRAGCCDSHFTYFPTPVPYLTIPNDCNLIPSGHGTRHGRQQK